MTHHLDNFYNKLKNITYADRCDEDISQQQRGYYIFLTVLISELKGFITVVNAHMLHVVLGEAVGGS